MAQQAPQQFEKPVDQTAGSSASPVLEARVFTMPERYRHGAQATLHQPEVASAQPLAPIAVKAPTAPPPLPSASKLTPPKKKSSSLKWILILGVIALVGLGIGGWLVLKSSQTAPPVAVVTPPATQPTPPVTKPETKPPVVAPSVTTIPEVFPKEIIPGVDTDSDGLTDVEENLIYKTNPRLPDTDADGFLDGNEVFHRYNPGGTSPGTLLESGLVKSQNSGVVSGIRFEWYYPSVWTTGVINTGTVFDTKTGEAIKMAIMAKPPVQTLTQWLASVMPGKKGTIGKTKNGLDMIQTDQLHAYVDLGPIVLTFVYDTGVKARVDYLQTFQMMLNSVRLMGVDEPVQDATFAMPIVDSLEDLESTTQPAVEPAPTSEAVPVTQTMPVPQQMPGSEPVSETVVDSDSSTQPTPSIEPTPVIQEPAL